MKKIIFSLLLLVLVWPRPALAQPNNKIGIHLAVPQYPDLESAARLVNSSHGDWGYVTLVMQEDERNQQKWQDIFNWLRRLHLIPIIRLATSPEGARWRRPDADEAQQWAEFLNSLHWVTKNRYLVLFNEPNHAGEWGGKVDAVHYGQTAFAFAQTLKQTHPDFFVMLAGLDAAAPSQLPKHEDEARFLRTIIANQPELFSYVDGWASHSYPNYGFVSSPTKTGRNSVKTYQWEINLLKQLGINKVLPVFITETGWPHEEGFQPHQGFFRADQVAQFFQTYLQDVLRDPQVIAITPFILNYQGEPFDHFSWQKPNSQDFYPQYGAVLGLSKQKGQPKQEQKLVIMNNLPRLFYNRSAYHFQITIRNEGQAIWSVSEGYQLCLADRPQNLSILFNDLPVIIPFGQTTVTLSLNTGRHLGQFDWQIAVCRNHQPVSNRISWPVKVLPKIKTFRITPIAIP